MTPGRAQCLVQLDEMPVLRADYASFRHNRLKSLLQPFASGPAAVRVRYRNAAAECDLQLGDAFRVRLEDALIEGLGLWLDAANVEIVYQ